MYEVELIPDVRIPTGDPDVTLAADLYRPHTEKPVPTLVTVLPYRKDLGPAAADLPWFAARGYAALLVDLTGTGSSDGRMRPPFDPGEADDAIAAIDWAAAQPWCTGAVGMWGTSYGAVTTLRAASHRPDALRAIIAVEGVLDPERDFVHPGGARGGLTALVNWGTSNLITQLLPAMRDRHAEPEYWRWRQRIEHGEPYVTELFRRAPHDPVWRERVIDADAITAPALVVGGWRDFTCDGTVRAFERITAPKKLIMGPWMHTMPHESPHQRVDFRAIALRWWDHWLRGIDTGITSEPPVQLYHQGAAPGWQAYESWPPPAGELVLATGAGATLHSPDAVPNGEVGRYVPDPTAGALAGLWSFGSPGYGLPLDQHDDDARALPVTSEPLPADLLVTGRPAVMVRLAGPRPSRLVVRLTDVDPDDRSILVTSGVLCPLPAEGAVRVLLWPTSYRFAAGHRLRVTVGDADFPRLWPVPDAVPWSVTGIELATPVAEPGAATELPHLPGEPEEDTGIAVRFEPRWEIARDPLGDGIEVAIGANTELTVGGRKLELRTDTRASVRRTHPEAARMRATNVVIARLGTGETISATATTGVTGTSLRVSGEVRVDGDTVYHRTWLVTAR